MTSCRLQLQKVGYGSSVSLRYGRGVLYGWLQLEPRVPGFKEDSVNVGGAVDVALYQQSMLREAANGRRG